MAKVVASSTQFEPIKLKYYRVLIGALFFLVISGALSIPFVYESQTLWYKFGADKIILRTGQMAGLLTAVLLFIQVLLAVRGKILQQLVGIATLMRWHRVNGIIVLLLAIGHMLLVLIPEGLNNLPIGRKYWPEMVGMLLLTVIISLVFFAQWRQQLRLNYQRWRTFHKLSGHLIIALIVIHVLFVSDTFEQTVPRVALLVSLVGLMLAVFVGKKATKPAKVQG